MQGGYFKNVFRVTEELGNFYCFLKIVLHSLTFEGQVAKSIRTLELNFNFLNDVRHENPCQRMKHGLGVGRKRHAAESKSVSFLKCRDV